MASQQAKPLPNLIHRGVYRSDPVSTATFVGLRALDPFLQYHILAKGWGGLPTIPSTIGLVPTGLAFVDALGLPLPRLIMLAMAAGSAAKQIFWLTYVSKEEFPLKATCFVSAFNTTFNSINSFLLITAATTATLVGPQIRVPLTKQTLSLPVVVGSIMYLAGMAMETVSELQRKRFKDDPQNKGKICDVGLWSKVRQPNYGGYTLWRSGYALAAGGWAAGTGVAAFFIWDFTCRAIPEMDRYLAGRYGEQYENYKKTVTAMLIPAIY